MHLTNTTLGGGGDGTPAESVSKDEFVAHFTASHPDRDWASARRDIDAMLGECFSLARGEGGLGGDARGRAFVGVDVLLDRALVPHLIEINASPNTIGLCKERPGFFDEVFTECFVPPASAARRVLQTGFRPLHAPVS